MKHYLAICAYILIWECQDCAKSLVYTCSLKDESNQQKQRFLKNCKMQQNVSLQLRLLQMLLLFNSRIDKF